MRHHDTDPDTERDNASIRAELARHRHEELIGEYRDMLLASGPKIRELILARAAQDRRIDLEELVNLCHFADWS